MGRFPRIEGQSFVYFICTKGKNSQEIFKDNQDRLFFINLLKRQKVKGQLHFYSYVLLPGLYACLLETSKNNIVRSMHRINSGYANYFSRRYNLRNKIFHDRYQCFIIDKKNYLVEVSRYLYQLPVELGAVRSPMDLEWSSLPGYCDQKYREDWIDYSDILNFVGNNLQNTSLAYKEYVLDGINQEIQSPFKNLKEGIILGNEGFVKEVKVTKKIGYGYQSDDFKLADKIIHVVNNHASWSALSRNKVDINNFSLVRNASIYFLKEYTDLSNHQISTFFKSLQASSISQMRRRFILVKKKNNLLNKITDEVELKINALLKAE